RAWRERLDERSREVQRTARLAATLAGYWLEAQGYHRIKRGPWRGPRRRQRGRGGAMPTTSGVVTTGLEIHGPAGLNRSLSEADGAIVRRAQEGDRTALSRLRELFEQDPEGLLHFYGDLAAT